MEDIPEHRVRKGNALCPSVSLCLCVALLGCDHGGLLARSHTQQQGARASLQRAGSLLSGASGEGATSVSLSVWVGYFCASAERQRDCSIAASRSCPGA